jgi:hypothetical protein
VFLHPQPASAHYLWHEDADDTSANFDIAGVRLFKKSDPNRGVLRVRTHEEIDLGEDPAVDLFVDSRGDARADRLVRAVFDGGSSGFICEGVYDIPREEWAGTCEFDRHDDQLWQISFSWRDLDATRHVRWKVQTAPFYLDEALDNAPDTGWFAH